jgi:hypothetical protein
MPNWAYFLIGIIVLYSIVILFTRTPDFVSGKFTKGTVVTISEEAVYTGTRSGSVTKRVPVVDYVVNGRQYQFYDNSANWPPVYKEGQTVTMIYDPDDPRNACIFALIGYWLNISEVMVALFVLGIPAAIYFAVHGRKK